MTARKKATGEKGRARKLKLKKETLKDLDARKKGEKVKGGDIVVYATVGCTLIYCATAKTDCNCGPPRATGNVWCF